MKVTADWFTDHAPVWRSVLDKRIDKLATINALFVRPFEGLPMIWFADNMAKAKGKRATYYVVDDYSYPAKARWNDRLIPLPPVKPTFTANVKEAGLTVTTESTLDHLPKSLVGKMDLIYIDSLTAQEALESMVRSFPYLKPGGTLVATNYTHNKEHDARCPRVGIDAFLNTYVDRIKVLRTAWHVFIEKRKSPLKRGECRSEYFS